MSPYEWLTSTGLRLDRFYDSVRLLPDRYPDNTGYYSSPLKVVRLGASGFRSTDLAIAGRQATINEKFTLCNMVAWAGHYGLTSPLSFVLTTALGVYLGQNSDHFRPNPRAFTQALHSLGVETNWQPNNTWYEAKDGIINTLNNNFPLASVGKNRVQNEAFLPLAESRDLHLSAFAFFLASLVEHYD